MFSSGGGQLRMTRRVGRETWQEKKTSPSFSCKKNYSQRKGGDRYSYLNSLLPIYVYIDSRYNLSWFYMCRLV